MTEIPPAGPTVFLSYAHDSESHKSTVVEFANFLEIRGIAVALDLWHEDTRRDWYAWVLREIQGADFVIVVASPQYRAVGDGTAPSDLHRGVQAETAAVRDLLYRDRETWLGRVVPVVLPGCSLDDLPTFTQPYSASHFVIQSIDESGTEHLLRVLTGQPRYVRPTRGRVPALPSGSDSSAPTKDADDHAIGGIDERPELNGGWSSRLKLWLSQPIGWVTLTAAGFAAAIVAVWLLFGLSWITTVLILTTSIGVLTAVQRYGRKRLSTMWKVVCLAAVPLLVGILVALPGTRAPGLNVTADESPRTPVEDRSPSDGSPKQSTTDDPRQGSSSTAAGSAQAPQADQSATAPTKGRAQPGTSQGASLRILAVGHSFTPDTDRVTVSVQNNRPDPVLVK